MKTPTDYWFLVLFYFTCYSYHHFGVYLFYLRLVGALTSSERELGQSISSKLDSVLRGNTGVLQGNAAGKREQAVSHTQAMETTTKI